MIAERYAQGIQHDMPLIGWSISKNITHALNGRAIQEGLLDPDKPPKVPEWSDPQDPRREISLDQLLRMNSGLAFEESTGALNSDLVRMLTQEADMARFAASQLLSKNREKWRYSSATTNILSRIQRHAIDDDQHYWSLPKQTLFEPLGMTTAVLESDNSGTLVGPSLVWASGRDWARFGQLYRSRQLERQATSARDLGSTGTDGFAGIQAGLWRAMVAQPPQIRTRSAQ